MAKYRICLHLALALTLVSLTCDLGAVCALAGMEGQCCCPVKMASGRSPCTDVSGGDAPARHEPDAAVESGERFAAAVLDGAPLPAASGAPFPAPGVALAPALQAAPTPLFLSHCAFLC